MSSRHDRRTTHPYLSRLGTGVTSCLLIAGTWQITWAASGSTQRSATSPTIAQGTVPTQVPLPTASPTPSPDIPSLPSPEATPTPPQAAPVLPPEPELIPRPVDRLGEPATLPADPFPTPTLSPATPVTPSPDRPPISELQGSPVPAPLPPASVSAPAPSLPSPISPTAPSPQTRTSAPFSPASPVPKASPPQLSPQASPPLTAPPSPTTPFSPYVAPVELTDPELQPTTTSSSLPSWLGWVIVAIALLLAGTIYQLLLRQRRPQVKPNPSVPLESDEFEPPASPNHELDASAREPFTEPPEPPQTS